MAIEIRAEHNDDIQSLRIPAFVLTKNFPYQTFALVPLDRFTYPAAGYNAQASGQLTVHFKLQIHDEGTTLEAISKDADLLKVFIRAQTL